MKTTTVKCVVAGFNCNTDESDFCFVKVKVVGEYAGKTKEQLVHKVARNFAEGMYISPRICYTPTDTAFCVFSRRFQWKTASVLDATNLIP